MHLRILLFLAAIPVLRRLATISAESDINQSPKAKIVQTQPMALRRGGFARGYLLGQAAVGFLAWDLELGPERGGEVAFTDVAIDGDAEAFFVARSDLPHPGHVGARALAHKETALGQ